MIKEIPILFSTPMVVAADNETKTITRRIRGLEYINELPSDWKFSNMETNPRELFGDPDHEEPKLKTLKGLYAVFYDDERAQFIKCPYGNVGDRIWVREKWRYSDDLQNPYNYYAQYKEDYTPEYLARTKGWKPSIHMPKIAARLWLEITEIKVERLQDISEQDAKSEGVKTNSIDGSDDANGEWWNYNAVDFDDFPCYSAKESFQSLWLKINGPESWEANPWVWVVKFKKIHK